MARKSPENSAATSTMGPKSKWFALRTSRGVSHRLANAQSSMTPSRAPSGTMTPRRPSSLPGTMIAAASTTPASHSTLPPPETLMLTSESASTTSSGSPRAPSLRAMATSIAKNTTSSVMLAMSHSGSSVSVHANGTPRR